MVDLSDFRGGREALVQGGDCHLADLRRLLDVGHEIINAVRRREGDEGMDRVHAEAVLQGEFDHPGREERDHPRPGAEGGLHKDRVELQLELVHLVHLLHRQQGLLRQVLDPGRRRLDDSYYVLLLQVLGYVLPEQFEHLLARTARLVHRLPIVKYYGDHVVRLELVLDAPPFVDDRRQHVVRLPEEAARVRAPRHLEPHSERKVVVVLPATGEGLDCRAEVSVGRVEVRLVARLRSGEVVDPRDVHLGRQGGRRLRRGDHLIDLVGHEEDDVTLVGRRQKRDEEQGEVVARLALLVGGNEVEAGLLDLVVDEFVVGRRRHDHEPLPPRLLYPRTYAGMPPRLCQVPDRARVDPRPEAARRLERLLDRHVQPPDLDLEQEQDVVGYVARRDPLLVPEPPRLGLGVVEEGAVHERLEELGREEGAPGRLVRDDPSEGAGEAGHHAERVGDHEVEAVDVQALQAELRRHRPRRHQTLHHRHHGVSIPDLVGPVAPHEEQTAPLVGQDRLDDRKDRAAPAVLQVVEAEHHRIRRARDRPDEPLDQERHAAEVQVGDDVDASVVDAGSEDRRAYAREAREHPRQGGEVRVELRDEPAGRVGPLAVRPPLTDQDAEVVERRDEAGEGTRARVTVEAVRDGVPADGVDLGQDALDEHRLAVAAEAREEERLAPAPADPAERVGHHGHLVLPPVELAPPEGQAGLALPVPSPERGRPEEETVRVEEH
mmetsp:Transcript_12048/g.27461  ORF Transcript_12048/g.27461 Transcript_12048/m.27461 type:complete len:720 (+) Transcript_12048:947-3106(+)